MIIGRWMLTTICAVSLTLLASARSEAADMACEGKLEIGGKTYKLTHAVAYPTKLFDEEVINVLTSSKPIAVDKLKTALRTGDGGDDRFMIWDPHIKISFKKSGEVQYCNAWADNISISMSGSNLTGDVSIKNGRATGKATLVPDQFTKHIRGFQLVFDVSLLANPAAAKANNPSSPENSHEAKIDAEAEIPAAPTILARSLPMPKDATDVEFNDFVEHISYKSRYEVKAVATMLVQQLAAQGWNMDGRDLITPKSCIMRRNKGKAELTIFVKLDGASTKVLIMSEGLTW